MKCPKCNAENPDTVKFCGECGTQLPSLQDIDITETIETPKEELTTGSTFASRYQIIEELGKGGMGRVYRALDKELNEEVAIKLIKPEIAKDKKTIERFKNELKIARKISHRNVGRMYELMEDRGSHFITMEYVPGQDLRGLIRQTGQLTTGKAIAIAKEICEGLGEAHHLGVVHRDLKPSNIIIDRDGSARILDFGIAKSITGKAITGAGVMIGTPEYMSPEQVEGKEVDLRSDIYSLGIILYEMTTGRVPFVGDTPFTVGVKHKSEFPQNPKEINPQIPDALNHVILKCLEKDKENRFQSAADVKSELEKIEQGLPTTDRVIPKKRPLTSRDVTVQLSIKKLLVPAFIVVALVFTGLIIWSPWTQKSSKPSPTDKPSLGVAYFENRTQMPDLDKSIIEMFSINLSQFGGIKIVSQQLLSEILRQTGNDDSRRIDESTTLEIAKQANLDYIIAGSVFEVGQKISLTAQLIEVQGGTYLPSDRVEGNSFNDVMGMVDELTERLSERLGISGEKVESFKIADVTTDSLEAFGHYQKGITHFMRFDIEAAIKELQKAIDIDPEFAAAYVYLSFVLAGYDAAWNPYTDMTQSKETLEHAERLSHKIREQERMMIALQKAFLERDSQKYKERAIDFVKKYPENELANFSLCMAYYTNSEFENAINVIEKYLEINPAHAISYNMLAYSQAGLQNHSEAVSAVNKYIALDSDISAPYDSAWEVCMISGEYEEALGYCRKALEKFPEAYYFYHHMGHTYLLMGDVKNARSMYRLYCSESAFPEWSSRYFDGLVFLFEGKLTNAFSEFKRRFDLLQKEEMLGRMTQTLQDLGKILIYQGKYAEAIDTFERAEKMSWDIEGNSFNPFPVLFQHKIGLAQIGKGDLDSTRRSIEIIKQYIQEQRLEAFYLNFAYLLEAAIHGAQKNWPATSEALKKCSPSFGRVPFYINSSAEACVLNNELAQAVELYQSFKTNISMSRYGNDAIFFFRYSSLADYNLGKVYELMGSEANATEHYEKFLDLWNDADPGIAEVEDARERLARLTLE